MSLKVEEWPTSRLVEYARNPRKNDPHVDRMAGMIKEFGFRIPVVAKSDGTVVDGHLRLKAARKLSLPTIPVALADGLTDAQIKAFRLLANKSVAWSEWDTSLLAEEFGDFPEGFDLTLTGFDLSEIDFIVHGANAGAGLTDPDDTPEPPVSPVSVIGDVWLLGKHRLVCGDSTDVSVVAKALNGVQPHLMVTDPPYGVEYEPDWRGKDLKDGAKRAEGRVANDAKADWREAWALFPGEVAYVWHAGRHAGEVQASLDAAGFEIRSQIIWAKSHLAIGRGHYHWQHEPCWYAVKVGATGHWSGDRKQTTLWQIDKPQKSDTGHGTQKPIECMKRPIENNSSPGQAVYEPFSGSGTTIIAAEMTGRACHAIELSPTDVDVSVKRWQTFSGQTAKLEATGQTFDEIAAERPIAA